MSWQFWCSIVGCVVIIWGWREPARQDSTGKIT